MNLAQALMQANGHLHLQIQLPVQASAAIKLTIPPASGKPCTSCGGGPRHKMKNGEEYCYCWPCLKEIRAMHQKKSKELL